MLSVFITPCTNPTSIHRATSSAWAATTRRYSSRYGLSALGGVGVVAGDGVVGERAQHVPVAARGGVLERAHPQVARGDPAEHRTRQRPLALHRLAGGDDRERPRRRDAEPVHRLADDVLAQHRAHRGPAVAAAGERRAPGPLQVQVTPVAVAVDDLAEQQRPAVAQARLVHAELVARVGLRDRRDPVRQPVAGQQRHPGGRRQLRGVETELAGELRVEHEQLRRGRGRGRPRPRTAGHRAGVGGVELDQRLRDGHASRLRTAGVEVLQQIVGGQLDLLVPPLGGPVVARDQAHAVQAAEVAVDERVPRLGLRARPLGEREVPRPVLVPRVPLQVRVLGLRSGWTSPHRLERTMRRLSMRCRACSTPASFTV